MRKVLRSIAAAIGGYAVIVVLTTIAFPLLIGRGLVDRNDPREVAIGTLIAVVAGLAGGWVATWIGVLRPVANAALASIPVAIESTFLLLFRTPQDEIVFSAVGALVLIGSTIAAGVLRELCLGRYRSAPGAA